MRRFLVMLMAAAYAVPGLANALTYRFDPDQTEVRFYWDHAGVSEQSGEWRKIRGQVEFDSARIEATKISVTIDPRSVDTGVPAIDKFLTGRDMFDAPRNPTITYVSTGVKRTGENTARVRGKLTIKGKTEPVVLDVTLRHIGPHPLARFLRAYRGEWIGVQARGRIFRSQFNVGYGFPIISDIVRIEISAELKAN